MLLAASSQAVMAQAAQELAHRRQARLRQSHSRAMAETSCDKATVQPQEDLTPPLLTYTMTTASVFVY